jgi:hypothetical protein
MTWPSTKAARRRVLQLQLDAAVLLQHLDVEIRIALEQCSRGSSLAVSP